MTIDDAEINAVLALIDDSITRTRLRKLLQRLRDHINLAQAQAEHAEAVADELRVREWLRQNAPIPPQGAISGAEPSRRTQATQKSYNDAQRVQWTWRKWG